MRKLLSYLNDFRHEQFRWGFFISLVTFLGICLALNYRLDFKDTYITYFGTGFSKYPKIFMFYLLPLTVSLTMYSILGPGTQKKGSNPIKDYRVWVFILFSALAYTLAVGWTPWEQFVIRHVHIWGRAYAFTSSSFLLRTVMMIVFSLAWWFFIDRVRSGSIYGLRFSREHIGIYFTLACVAVALAALASLSPGFHKFYPMARPDRFAARSLDLSPITLLFIWEGVYLTHLFAVELFFRGFMVMGLGRIMGAGSIWIMASMYMFIHFSKPPMEAISSFFAGILLGVLALRTDSIFGGVVLHVTIALSMDLFALMHAGWF